MLPIVWHRTLIACSAALGGVVWMQVQPALAAADGSSGLSLFSTGAGFAPALLLLLLAAIPAVLMGVLTAATGHPVAGVFAVAVALAMLASFGGPIDGWMWRVELPVDYAALMMETVLWLALLLGLFVVIEKLRPVARRMLPWRDEEDPYRGVFDLTKLWNNKTAVSALVTAGIGGLLAGLLIRTADPGQVNGSLVVAFMIAALLGQTIVPNANPMGVLVSPALAALVGYGAVLLSGLNSSDAVLARWYANHLNGLAQALPIYYISAGVAGAALGFGMSRNMDQSRQAAAGTAGAGA